MTSPSYFDEIIPREGTDSYKLKYLKDVCGRTDVIPMWVADMDFRTPPFVMDTIQRRLQQGILGYTCTNEAYFNAICEWNRQEYGLDVRPEEISYVPGVVSGIFLSLLRFTEKGDKIFIQEPVYHPFHLVPEANERQVVMSSLRESATSFEMDFDRLRQDIKGCRMMILCNPHNPAGICWSRETLQEVAHICAEENVLVVSDEIHCDMLLGGRRHVPYASVSEEARMNSITLQAPTKTFNLPGIVSAHAIVFNPAIRRKLFSFIEGSDQDLGNVLCYDCTTACYSEEGRQWRDEMIKYVEGNVDLVVERMAKECPNIRPIRPEASFLVFLDCRQMGMTQTELIRFFADKAHVCFNSGHMFGPGGVGYMRMNVACPRSVVSQALDQIADALRSLTHA